MTTLQRCHIYSQQYIYPRNLPSVSTNPGIYPELLGFWTLSIVRNSKYQKTQRFGNYICFRPQVSGRRFLRSRIFFYSEDVGNTFLRNVRSYKTHMAPYTRWRHSSTQSGPLFCPVYVNSTCFCKILMVCKEKAKVSL
jgi:hypothetical protein